MLCGNIWIQINIDRGIHTMYKEQVLEFLSNTVKNAYLQIKGIGKEVSIKGKRDFVTNCDLLVEEYIIEQMKNNYPDVEIISEEINFNKERTQKYFAIDPIDGTINFANGLDIWGIQVAYVEDEEIIASCIYLPTFSLLFSALKDSGSFLNGNKIEVKEYENLDNSLVAFGFSRPNEKNYILYQEVSKKVIRVRDFGSAAYSFSMMANGCIDGYCILQNTAWDIEPRIINLY